MLLFSTELGHASGIDSLTFMVGIKDILISVA